MTDARFAAIEERNQRVERDKAWERSVTRRASIAIITYLTASAFFSMNVQQQEWYVAALIPPAGYLLSTLSLPWIRKIWDNRNK